MCWEILSPVRRHAAEDQAEPEWLSSLEELGILRGVSGRTCNKSLKNQEGDGFKHEITTSDKRISIHGAAHKEELTLPAYPLTVLGLDIVGLFSAPLDERYLSFLADDLKARGLDISVADKTASAADRKAS